MKITPKLLLEGETCLLHCFSPSSPRNNCSRWTRCRLCSRLVLKTAPRLNERRSTCVASSLSTTAWPPSSPTPTANRQRDECSLWFQSSILLHCFLYLFNGLFVVSEMLQLPLGSFVELLKDLFPPGCRLSWRHRQTHGLNGLKQGCRTTGEKTYHLTTKLCCLESLHLYEQRLYLMCRYLTWYSGLYKYSLLQILSSLSPHNLELKSEF